MIWRIRERDAFARLASSGRRIRAGVLWCTFITDPAASPPRVAFSVGRAVGPAVVRNLLRRRLRSVLRASPPPPGWYLIGARPAARERSYAELEFDLIRLCRTIGAAASTEASSG